MSGRESGSAAELTELLCVRVSLVNSEPELDGFLETDYCLEDVLSEASASVEYLYDLGDGWAHRIDLVERINSTDGTRARVIDGEH